MDSSRISLYSITGKNESTNENDLSDGLINVTPNRKRNRSSSQGSLQPCCLRNFDSASIIRAKSILEERLAF